jgi:hypothetical protein
VRAPVEQHLRFDAADVHDLLVTGHRHGWNDHWRPRQALRPSRRFGLAFSAAARAFSASACNCFSDAYVR